MIDKNPFFFCYYFKAVFKHSWSWIIGKSQKIWRLYCKKIKSFCKKQKLFFPSPTSWLLGFKLTHLGIWPSFPYSQYKIFHQKGNASKKMYSYNYIYLHWRPVFLWSFFVKTIYQQDRQQTLLGLHCNVLLVVFAS